jgi:hypothetical protein
VYISLTRGNIVLSLDIEPVLNVKEPYEINFSFLVYNDKLIVGRYDGKVKSYLID